MAAVYESMAAAFLNNGLNLEAIMAIRQFYGGLETHPEPLFYEDFPTALQQGAVRLLVFQPATQDPLIQLAHSACQDILASFPAGMLEMLCVLYACAACTQHAL